jgi:ATP-dependent DNA helicase DinG
MVTADEKKQITTALSTLSGSMPGYRTRDEQMKMIEAIAEGLASSGSDLSIPVISAGTGIGKSLGAALPAIVLARSRSKRVVIATSTVNLQAQLHGKDLPVLAAAIKGGFSVAVAKGRGRFLCRARLESAIGDEAAGAPNVIALPFTEQGQRHAGINVLVQALDEGWNGDRDDLKNDVSDEVWSSVTNDWHGCAKQRCPAFGRCVYFQARAQTQSADVIVANHDVLLNAVQEGRQGLLPDLQECFVIADEAHALPAKAAGMAGTRLSLREAIRWIKAAPDRVERAVHALALDAGVHAHAKAAATTLTDNLADLGRALRSSKLVTGESVHRFRHGRLPDWLHQLLDNARIAAGEMRDALQECVALVHEASAADSEVQSAMSDLGPLVGRAISTRAALDLICSAAEAAVPMAKWVEQRHTPKGNVDFVLNASPVSGAAMLRERLWTRVGGAAAVSATLAPGGSFDSFLDEAGLTGLTTRLLDLQSPFDYPSRARLLVMPMRSDPRNHAAHTREVTRVLPRLIQTLGTLTLFASRRQMTEVYEGLDEELRAQVLMQGTLPKAELLRQHRQRIADGERSILFGLQAMSEGLDLPGEQCSHVIICKLPFSCIADPVEEAKAEWLESQGRSAFEHMALPTVGIRLAQAAGRLLRRETDSGIVTVLDRRLGSTAWGRKLLEGLPPFATSIFPDDVDASLRGLPSEGVAREAEAA